MGSGSLISIGGTALFTKKKETNVFPKVRIKSALGKSAITPLSQIYM